MIFEISSVLLVKYTSEIVLKFYILISKLKNLFKLILLENKVFSKFYT